MSRIKIKHLSNDGKEFDTELERDTYEKSIELEYQVEAYISHIGVRHAQSGLLRKHLPGFVAFMDGNHAAKLTLEQEAKSSATEAAVKAVG
jgi:hypothetical protein